MAAEFPAAGAAGRSSAAGDAVGSRGTGDDGDDGQLLAWYGDSAYGTGDLRDAIGKAGHQAVIKPKPAQPAVEGGFTVDFTVDVAAGTVTCSRGITQLCPGKHMRQPVRVNPAAGGTGHLPSALLHGELHGVYARAAAVDRYLLPLAAGSRMTACRGLLGQRREIGAVDAAAACGKLAFLAAIARP